jgi:DNA-binding NarL/FixJ family response regulator
MAISVVLVEDHQVVREGVRALLEAQPEFAVIGEAASGLGVTDLVERLTPDVLILDLMLPGLSGLEVARQVSHRIPTTRILVLSMHANEAYVLQALSSGASGYILKDSSAQDLVRAIHEVMAGRRFLSPPLSERAIEAYMQKAQDALLDPYDALTSREREVLHLAAEGRTNAEIATELSISPRTAEVHRANLMRKLSLRNQTELIRYALRRGILPMDT